MNMSPPPIGVLQILVNACAREAEFVFTALHIVLVLPSAFILTRFHEAIAALEVLHLDLQ